MPARLSFSASLPLCHAERSEESQNHFRLTVIVICHCAGKNFAAENKKSPVKGRGNLMFSQRNNPYCELLQISMANIQRKNNIQVSFQFFLLDL